MDSRSGVAEEKPSKAIRKKVKNSESVALQRYKIDTYNLVDLDKVLSDIHCSCRPVPADYDARKDTLKHLDALALDIFYGEDSKCGRPVLKTYGSFAMDMFFARSDLDVSVNFGDGASELPRDSKLHVLGRFAEKLRSLQGEGHVRNVVSILSARVPIVRFVDQRTSVECDLAVDSKEGVLNSRIIQIISQIDDRFQKLCLLIKHWAKAHDVNSATHNTLNSISITLLVAHHLQTQDPPILPPFSLLFKDGIDPLNVEKRTQEFLNWGKRNKESLGRLFVTFFVKLQSVEFLWRQGLCVSLLSGLWISKRWRKTGVGINVEDFIDVSQNVARVVNDRGAKKIYGSINKTVEDLFEFLNGKVDGAHLKDMLFVPHAIVEPPPPPPRPPVQPVNVYHKFPRHNYRCDEFKGRHNKRPRLGYGGSYVGDDDSDAVDLPPPPPPLGRVYKIYCDKFGPQNLT
ncbi:Nucleotidyltransferase family protein [Hirschfeldia incana]|nr:Nucleotidyltransferase family protein [Hirschfeldia incana]